jgi:hypothetical protein
MEVAGANRRWRGPFRCRGSRRESAVAQLSTLGHKNMDMRAQYWRQGLAEPLLDMWPAQELFCIDAVWWASHTEKWKKKWSEAGGRFFDGRMIALKNDPVWKRISPKGRYYPPFHKADLLETRDIERGVAEAYGLITSIEILDVKAFDEAVPISLTKPCK